MKIKRCYLRKEKIVLCKIDVLQNEKNCFDEVNTFQMYFEGVFLTLICIGAFIGNLSIWIIICKSKDLRTVTNAFILSLTTADLLVAFINMPVTILTIFFGDWIMEDKECIIFGFINMFTLVLSVMSLCNISINRYIMVCKPIHFKTIYTKRNACIMICSKYFGLLTHRFCHQ